MTRNATEAWNVTGMAEKCVWVWWKCNWGAFMHTFATRWEDKEVSKAKEVLE